MRYEHLETILAGIAKTADDKSYSHEARMLDIKRQVKQATAAITTLRDEDTANVPGAKAPTTPAKKDDEVPFGAKTGDAVQKPGAPAAPAAPTVMVGKGPASKS